MNTLAIVVVGTWTFVRIIDLTVQKRQRKRKEVQVINWEDWRE